MRNKIVIFSKDDKSHSLKVKIYKIQNFVNKFTPDDYSLEFTTHSFC